MTQTYRDPTFEEVAAREAAALRTAAWLAEKAARLAQRRADPGYRAMRRRKIARLLKLAKAGRLA